MADAAPNAAADAAPDAAADAAPDAAAPLWAELQQLGATLAGIGYDATGGHPNDPYRSIIRRTGFELGLRRHATKAQAALRILEAIRDHEPYTPPPGGSR